MKLIIIAFLIIACCVSASLRNTGEGDYGHRNLKLWLSTAADVSEAPSKSPAEIIDEEEIDEEGIPLDLSAADVIHESPSHAPVTELENEGDTSNLGDEGLPLESEENSIGKGDTGEAGKFNPSQPGCFIEVDIGCIPTPGSSSTNCEDLLVPNFAPCESEPHEIQFKFVGGICNQYDMPQPEGKFMCLDQGEGPVIEGTDKSNYIEVFPPEMTADIYFSGEVTVGSTFVIKDKDTTDGNAVPLSETLTVFVYDDATKERLLQTMIFHTMCKDDIDLGDRYGSLLVTAFSNALVEANSLKTIAYQVNFKNNAFQDVLISHVLNIADQEARDLLGGEGGPTLGAGSDETVVEEILVDLAHPRSVGVSVTVSGHDEQMNSCSAFAQMVLKINAPDTAS
jgi:hypothetical protein